MSDIVSFGEWVQARRNQLGISRTVLARQIACSPVTIKKIERDERRPSEQLAELLAAHLKVPATEQDDFVRRARGEFVPQLLDPLELSLAEAQVAAEEESIKHNLPAQTTSFTGRSRELSQIAANLADPNCRLLTILGAGGMGKTRLGIEAATTQLPNFTDGITYVALAPINAPTPGDSVDPVSGALADALRISFNADSSPKAQILNYLRRKEMLLLLDNIEHLLDMSILVRELLVSAPDIKILVTSRESLNIPEEWVLLLPGLPFPGEADSADETASFAAVELFAQRARQARISFDLDTELAAVWRICQLVEGMPLGLELAAAWTRQLSCSAIALEIEKEVDFLTTRMRHVPERHRSIRAVFAYSWELLSSEEQAALQRLSVFRGGFEREAAKDVANASLYLLSGLVDKSLLGLVGTDPDSSPRYHIHELLRQFAAEKLDRADGKVDAQNAHSRYYLTLVAEQEARLRRSTVLNALAAIERDIDNVRVALQWGIRYQMGLFNQSLGFVLWQYYELRGWFLEAEATFGLIARQFKQLCDSNPLREGEAPSAACILWAQYNAHLGSAQARLGFPIALATIRQSLASLPTSVPHARWARSYALLTLGFYSGFTAEQADASAYLREGIELAGAIGDELLQAIGLIIEGQLAHEAGDYQTAQDSLERCDLILKSMGEGLWNSYVLSNLGRLAATRGDFAAAEAFQQECLRQRQTIGDHMATGFALKDLGDIARQQGNYPTAHRYYQQHVAIAQQTNHSHDRARGLWSLGNLALVEGNLGAANRFFEESLQTGLDQKFPGGPGWVALELGAYPEAKELFLTALQSTLSTRNKLMALDRLVGLAHVIVHQGQITEALELLALAQHHPSLSHEIGEKVRRLWAELLAELPPHLVAEAESVGRSLDLWATIEAQLAKAGTS